MYLANSAAAANHSTNGSDLASRDSGGGIHLGALAILIDPQERVLLVDHPILGWSFPGGHVEPQDSNLIDTAQRELQEEVGVRAKIDWTHIGWTLDPATTRVKCTGYVHVTACFAGRLDRQIVVDSDALTRWWRPSDLLDGIYHDVAAIVDDAIATTSNTRIASTSTRLSAVALRAGNREETRRFFEKRGLIFREETHGQPAHDFAQLGDVVFEIYPAGDGLGDRFEFQCDEIISEPRTEPDPDGRLIRFVGREPHESNRSDDG